MLRAFFCWIIHYLIWCANSFIPLFFYLIALSLFLKHPFNFSEQYQEGVGLREDFDVRDPQDSQNGFAFEGKEVLITMDGELPEAKWKHPISPLRKD